MQQYLLPLLIVSSVSFAGIAYAVLRKAVQSSPEGLSLWIFFPLWLAFFSFEYFFLGPYSYINMDVDGNLAIPMGYFLANLHEGGVFSHNFGGGQDMYVWFPGMQYFQPENLLFYILPTWLVILFNKIMVGALAFIGTYLLARRAAPGNALHALALAAVYPVSHLYLTDYSTSFGTGFAAIPLAIYWCIGCTASKRYWWLVAASAVILSAADPMKVFPALAVAYVVGLILLRDVTYFRAIMAMSVCIAVSILNWHEVIYGPMSSMASVARGFGIVVDEESTLGDAIRHTFSAVTYYWLPAGLFAISIALLAWRRSEYILRGGAALIFLLVSITFVDAFDWALIGLDPLNKLSHQQYMVLALGTIVTPVAAMALSGVENFRMRFLPRPEIRLPLFILAVALGTLAFAKGSHLASLFYFGGQAQYAEIKTLSNPTWNPAPNFRTVTFYEAPNANLVAGYYGFETFDGQFNLNNKLWSAYWAALLHGNKRHALSTRLGWFWDLWNGESYAVERHVRLDLLAIANVRYLFSPLPLKSAALKLLHAPPRDEWARVRPGFFDGLLPFLRHRLKRVFDAGDIFVYELRAALPRAFAVTGVISVPETQDEGVFYNFVANNAIAGAAVAWSSVAARLGDAQAIKVLNVASVRDGYDISVSSPNGGILALNQTLSPFWRAYDQDSRPLSPEPVNGVHMAVKLAPGTSEVRFRYERPLLRELLVQKFQ